jgi:hypothetical protein
VVAVRRRKARLYAHEVWLFETVGVRHSVGIIQQGIPHPALFGGAVFDAERSIAECEHSETEGSQATMRDALRHNFLHRSPSLAIMNIV